MAIISMKKLDLVALKKDRKAILEKLQLLGVTEIIEIKKEGLDKISMNNIIQGFNKDIEIAKEANDILTPYVIRKKNLLSSFEEGREIKLSEFNEKIVSYKETIKQCQEIIESKEAINSNNDEINRLVTEKDSISKWLALDMPMDFKGTDYTRALIATVYGNHTKETISEILDEAFIEKLYEIEIISTQREQTAVFIVCHKDIRKDIVSALRKIEYIPIDSKRVGYAKEESQALEERIKLLKEENERYRDKIIDFTSVVEDIELVIDYLEMRTQKYEVISSLGNTRHTFVISAYIPEEEISKCFDNYLKDYIVAYDIYDPEEEEDVPVLLKNDKFVAPVESITEMYALPGKGDIDPSPVMAFFYYLLFGIMFSDAGYGVIMALVSALILRKKNIKESARKTFAMFFYCGISTIFWGAIFGSWFGDIVPVIYTEFLNKPAPNLALWFDPVSNPMKFLIFAFIVGIIHLFSGVLARAKMSVNEKKYLEAVFVSLPVIILVVGGALLAGNFLITVPSSLLQLGKYMAFAGIILVIIGEIYMARNIFKGIASGAYGLYNIASGYLSDILSYSRLLALGLATGSIAGVMNLIGVIPESLVAKAILLPIVFIIGHSANFAINALGAYVHSNRLMFVELFSKFYEGGGRAFKPFKINSTYLKIEEDN